MYCSPFLRNQLFCTTTATRATISLPSSNIATNINIIINKNTKQEAVTCGWRRWTFFPFKAKSSTPRPESSCGSSCARWPPRLGRRTSVPLGCEGLLMKWTQKIWRKGCLWAVGGFEGGERLGYNRFDRCFEHIPRNYKIGRKACFILFGFGDFKGSVILGGKDKSFLWVSKCSRTPPHRCHKLRPVPKPPSWQPSAQCGSPHNQDCVQRPSGWMGYPYRWVSS